MVDCLVGNHIGDSAHYVRTDGQQRLLGDVDLVVHTFNRDFTQALPVSDAAKAGVRRHAPGHLRPQLAGFADPLIRAVGAACAHRRIQAQGTPLFITRRFG